MNTNTDFKKYPTHSPFYEALLVSFPIWLPVIYCLILFNFPFLSLILVWVVLFGLGEMHFGITWIFVFDKRNYEFIINNKLYSIYIPVMIVVFFLFVWFVINPYIAVFISTLFNVFHVTRQSAGITKLYTKNEFYKKIASYLIYLNTLLCLGYGFFNYLMIEYINFQIINFLFYLALLILILSILYCFLLILTKKEDMNTWLASITGIVLYSPFLSNLDIIQASAIGIGMHYSQYITLQIILYYRKLKEKNIEKRKWNVFDIITNNKYIFVFYLLFYTILMGLLFHFGRTVDENNESIFGSLNILFLIPFIFHNLHFYADMFMWKFSNPHIRKNIGSYLFT